MSDRSQKTEQPTSKRKREAVRDGQVPRSSDVGAWLTVLSCSVLAPATVRSLRALFDRLMDAAVAVIVHPESGTAMHVLTIAGAGVARTLAPVLVASMVVAVAGSAVQGGLRVSPKRFKPKFEKLNVVKGIKQMLGIQAAWNLAKALLKLAVFGIVVAALLQTAVGQFSASGGFSLSTTVATSAGSALRLVRLVALSGLAVAGVDFLIERRRVRKSLMMSPDEIKKETRQSDGDPHQKAALRARQYELSSNRMMASIASADVIVVNPTHVAVALRYESSHGAPRVVAKGSGAVAARIRAEAEKHRRSIVRDVPLARTLYHACEVGDEIPVELYDAVARVLAFVLALRRRGSAGGTYRVPALAGSGEASEPSHASR
jgi:flagellar biosynthetic protein FlhB